MSRSRRTLAAFVVTVLVAGLAAASAPPFPRAGTEAVLDHFSSAQLYFDARLETSLPGGECVAPFPTSSTPTLVNVCGEAGLWHDVNADGFVDAAEWTGVCDPAGYDAVLLPTSPGFAWGPFGTLLLPSAVIVTAGPVFVHLDCVSADGHYHGTTQAFLPTGNDPGFAIVLDAEACASYAGGVECVRDTDVY